MIAPMNEYQTLVDSAEKYLQALKSSGVRHVTVRAETLVELTKPASMPIPVARAVAPQSTAVVPVAIAQQELAGPAAPEMSREQKETAMASLRERAMACIKCSHLVAARKNVVFGVGDIHSPLMFIGEAPGADEDAQGEPFVGAAGQLLTRIIQTMGFTRQSVYIANILKCRPDTPGQAYGNRKPTPDEMKTCLPFLLAQIEIIRPKVIVALGATAIEGLLGKGDGIGKLRGHWLRFREIPLMPTFHPAYLLRNQALSEKRKVWEDMLLALEQLGAPITEKQSGYFLKA